MFTRHSLIQQRGLENFLGIFPECNSGACDKGGTTFADPKAPKAQTTSTKETDIAYRYRYNPQTRDIEYLLP